MTHDSTITALLAGLRDQPDAALVGYLGVLADALEDAGRVDDSGWVRGFRVEHIDRDPCFDCWSIGEPGYFPTANAAYVTLRRRVMERFTEDCRTCHGDGRFRGFSTTVEAGCYSVRCGVVDGGGFWRDKPQYHPRMDGSDPRHHEGSFRRLMEMVETVFRENSHRKECRHCHGTGFVLRPAVASKAP
jgi:hypothetical protein